MTFSRKRISSLLIITFFVALVFTANAYQQKEERKAQNLQVLPKDISHDALIKEMQFYNQSLNVKCNYCHAAAIDRPGKLNYASDSNVHKADTREMMRMTDSINQQYFQTPANTAQAANVVNCYTCHRGEEMPLVLPPVDSTRH